MWLVLVRRDGTVDVFEVGHVDIRQEVECGERWFVYESTEAGMDGKEAHYYREKT